MTIEEIAAWFMDNPLGKQERTTLSKCIITDEQGKHWRLTLTQDGKAERYAAEDKAAREAGRMG